MVYCHTHCLSHSSMSYPLIPTASHIQACHTHCLSHSCHTHCLSHSSMSYPLPLTFEHVIPSASHIRACHTHCLLHSSMSYPLPLTFEHGTKRTLRQTCSIHSMCSAAIQPNTDCYGQPCSRWWSCYLTYHLCVWGADV